MASNLFNCRKEVINAPPVPSISRCIHIVYRHKNVWEYQWSNFIYNNISTFLHYVHYKDALLDCSAPGGERCESLNWVDEIIPACTTAGAVTHVPWCLPGSLTHGFLRRRWWGKRSRRIRNLQFYLSGKRPIHHCIFVINHWPLRDFNKALEK